MAIPMDQREGWIWFDGELKPWKDAKLHSPRPHPFGVIHDEGREDVVEPNRPQMITACPVAQVKRIDQHRKTVGELR